MHTSLSQKQKQTDSTDSSFLNDSDIPDLKTREAADAMSHYKGSNSINLPYNFGNIAVHPKESVIIHSKLTVNTPGDRYEQEADAMADKVMDITGAEVLPQEHVSVNVAQRKLAEGEKEDDDEKNGIQRKVSDNIAPPVSAAVQQILKSAGNPIDVITRSFMESRFGYDFGNVRIHDNPLAHQSAKDINALAYTHKNNIVFNAGQYSPESASGKKLLAHELTHVVQQARGMARLGSVIARQEAPPKSDQAQVAAPPQARQTLTPANAALQLLKNAYKHAQAGEHDKAKEILDAVQKFVDKCDRPGNFDEKFKGASGVSKTTAQVSLGYAKSAIHSLISWYRIAAKPSDGRWQYEINSFSVGVPFLDILAGAETTQSSKVVQAIEKPINYGAVYDELKEKAYGALISGLKSYRNESISFLRKQVAKLPPSAQPIANGLVDTVGFVIDLQVGLVLAVTGLVVGFAEGIVSTIVGIVKLAYGILKLLFDSLNALFGDREGLDADLAAMKNVLDNFWPGLKKMANDWWTKYQKASPEQQALMGGEFVGQVEAFIATFAFGGAKAGQVPGVAVKLTYPSVQVAKAIVITGKGIAKEVPVITVTAQTVQATVKVGEPAVAMAIAVPAVAKVAGGGGGGGGGKRRPSWQDSEETVGQYLGKNWEAQQGYRDGKLVKRDTFGRVVPDFYNSKLNIAAEVKNYDLANNIKDLIDVLVEQGGGRMAYMPQGVKQWLFLDIRGQTITDLAGTAAKIQKETGGSAIFERVYYITDTGIQRAL